MQSTFVRQVMREIMTIARGMTYIREKQFVKFGLEKGQHAFLTRVHENPGINQEKLSLMLKIDKTTASKTLKKLEQKGFVERRKSSQDSRNWEVYETEKLAGIYDEFEQLILDSSTQALSDLTDKDIEHLLSLLLHISNNVNNNWLKIKKQSKK